MTSSFAASGIRIAFGCEQLGGHGWGNIDLAGAENAVIAARHAGIALFDTADCYGKGESEQRLGRLLSRQRSSVLIATKFGVRFDSSGKVFRDSSPGWMRMALDESLRRLQTDCIDLYQMHYWDGTTPIEATIEALSIARQQGKIRNFGVSNFPNSASGLASVEGAASVSFEFSLANREHEILATAVHARGMRFLAYGTLGQGILTGKYTSSSKFDSSDRRSAERYANFHGDRLAKNLAIVDSLRHWADRLNCPVGSLASAWVLGKLPGAIAIVGVKNESQLHDAVVAGTIKLPADALSELDRLSAISHF